MLGGAQLSSRASTMPRVQTSVLPKKLLMLTKDWNNRVLNNKMEREYNKE
jgi:hypothetical protein